MEHRTDKHSVQVTYVHPNMVSHSFMLSYLRMFTYDLGHNRRLVPSALGVRCGAMQLVEARNRAMSYFIDNTEADWLFIVDTDMGFDKDIVDKLIETAEGFDQPVVVGALCFGIEEVNEDGCGGWRIRPFPTIFDWRENAEGSVGYISRQNYEKDVVTKVDATGAAALLVPRSAAEKVRANYGPNWFDQVQVEPYDRVLSEDFSFCHRLANVGVPVYVNTGVKTTHHKQIWFSDEYYRAE